MTTAEPRAAARDHRRASSRLEAPLDLMVTPLAWTDEDLKILGCNAAFARLVGKDRATLPGLGLREVLPLKRRGAPAALDLGRGAGAAERYEFQRGGRTLLLDIVTTSRAAERGGAAVMVEIADATERDKLAKGPLARREKIMRSLLEDMYLSGERLKATTSELRRSNRDLEQFAYVASHDLQEPLRMVTSYCQLLARRYKGKLDSDADEFIHYAVDGALRMQALISDLLRYAHAGAQAAALKPTDCRAVVERALADLAMTLKESGGAVTLGPLPTVKADAGQLTQLFQNLLVNALKFRKKDAAPAVSVGAERKAGGWEFFVRDNGIGIDPKHHERIFTIFQRLHGHGVYAGTGIGLALAKKIVDFHGGRIWVESEQGQGATFRFTMPDQGRPSP